MSAFNQFLVAVVSFTKRVYKISRRFKSASGGHIANEPHDWSAAYQSKVSWEEIRHEFRELREQELRQDSIVLRDFQTGSAEDVKEKFAWLRMSERLSFFQQIVERRAAVGWGAAAANRGAAGDGYVAVARLWWCC